MESSEVTMLLQRLGRGDRDAVEELLPLVYDHLRSIAGRAFAGQAPGHTLQPTVLVHEAYMNLVRRPSDWEGRSHFMAVAGRAMREVIIQHARARGRQKRGGDRLRVTLDEALVPDREHELDAASLDEALHKLEGIRPRVSRIVECRFFGGLTNRETAEALGVSLRTVEAEWTFAKAWLRAALAEPTP